jgi:hypothetical protein
MLIKYEETFQPADLGGPLSSICRATQYSRERRRENLKKAGLGWVEPHTQICRVELNPDMLAGHITVLVIRYAAEILWRKSGVFIQLDEEAVTKAVLRYAPGLSEGISEADAAGAPLYREMGESLTELLYGEMRFEIRQSACHPRLAKAFGVGSLLLGEMLVFGDFGSVLSHYLRIYSPERLAALWYRVTDSLIRCLANGFLSSFRPDLVAPRGLEFIIGLIKDPAHFLASLATIATVKGDWLAVEKITTDSDQCGLPSLFSDAKMPKRRIQGDTEDWRMRYAVGLASLDDGWHDSERPFAYMAQQARNTMRKRQRREEREHIRARKAGGRLESMTKKSNPSGNQIDERGFGDISAMESAGPTQGPWGYINERILESDHAKALIVSGGDAQFERVLNGLVLHRKTWTEIAQTEGVPLEKQKHFSGKFRAEFENQLRLYRERMRYYHRPPHRTADERQAAEDRNPGDIGPRADLGTHGFGSGPCHILMQDGVWNMPAQDRTDERTIFYRPRRVSWASRTAASQSHP